MYEDDKRPVPTTFEDMWQFFGDHMYKPLAQDKEIKIVADPKKLTERVKAMVCFTNGEVPDMPKSVLGKRDNSSCGSIRYCPRCPDRIGENSLAVPEILGHREQYCSQCKKY